VQRAAEWRLLDAQSRGGARDRPFLRNGEELPKKVMVQLVHTRSGIDVAEIHHGPPDRKITTSGCEQIEPRDAAKRRIIS